MRRAAIALLLLTAAVAAGALLRADRAAAAWLRRDREANMRALIAERRFGEAAAAAAVTLANRPLDPEANLISGVAALYRSIAAGPVDRQPAAAGLAGAGFDGAAPGAGRAAQTDGALLATAVTALRRALLDARIAAAEPAAQYALGKAYFHKGYFYYDLAVRYLEGSLALGYDGADTYEYLGLAYTELGDPRGPEYFRHALARRPYDLLHLRMAAMLADRDDPQGARDNLIRAIRLAGDPAVEQRARYELGAVYRTLDQPAAAEEQYLAIIAADDRAADAHFYLGEIYAQQGDADRARAAWSAAQRLEPRHRRAIERLRGG